jgi:hypothetical protein
VLKRNIAIDPADLRKSQLTVVYAEPVWVILAGFLSGLVLSLVPILYGYFNYGLGIIGPWMYGRTALYHGGFEQEWIWSYFSKGWPYITAFLVFCSFIAVMDRFFLARGKYFRIEGVTFSWDIVITGIVVPIMIVVLAPDLANLLIHAVCFLFFTGLILYTFWDLLFEFFIEHIGKIDRRALMNAIINDLLRTHDWLGYCTIEAEYDPVTKISVVNGFVTDRRQIEDVRTAVMKVKGVDGIETSAVKVGRPVTVGNSPGKAEPPPDETWDNSLRL